MANLNEGRESAVTKESFFAEAFSKGLSFKDTEAAWLTSGFAIKRGKSAKEKIREAWLAGEVNKENLKDWLTVEGTANDVRQSSYYLNRLEDFEEIAKAFGGKRKVS